MRSFSKMVSKWLGRGRERSDPARAGGGGGGGGGARGREKDESLASLARSLLVTTLSIFLTSQAFEPLLPIVSPQHGALAAQFPSVAVLLAIEAGTSVVCFRVERARESSRRAASISALD